MSDASQADFEAEDLGSSLQFKIQELEQQIAEMDICDVVPVIRVNNWYVAPDGRGGFKYEDTPDNPQLFYASKNLIKKVEAAGISYSIENKRIVNWHKQYHRDYLKEELEVYKKGFSSRYDMLQAEMGKREENERAWKEFCSQSIISSLLGDRFVYNIYNDELYIVDTTPIIKVIVKEAKKQGAELYSISKFKRKNSSWYLKKDGVKIRVSNHYLPPVMNRAARDYQEPWAENIVFESGYASQALVDLIALKTQDDFSEYVSGLFTASKD
jgi:hypothetical protein